MDEAELREEGAYGIFGRAGARTEMPGCSLCMGNQARVADNIYRYLNFDRMEEYRPRKIIKLTQV